jgi:uncharacterized protein YdcH (DUF465 family)
MRKSAVGHPDKLEVLLKEHRALDARLSDLQRHAYLSSEEQKEVATLKKMKLAKKDRIADLRERGSR